MLLRPRWMLWAIHEDRILSVNHLLSDSHL